MKLPVLILSLALLGCTAPPLAKQQARPVATTDKPTQPKRMFPTYTADNLNGTSITVPTGLPTDATVLLVGFKRRHQAPIDGWLKALDPVFARFTNVGYLELPVIREMGATRRWFLDTAMRRGIPKLATRARVVTLYLDKSEFRRQLGIANEDDIRVYLTRPTGEILWSAVGDVSPASVRGLVAALEASTATASAR